MSEYPIQSKSPESIAQEVEQLNQRQKDVISLAPIYFWLKYMRRNNRQENYEMPEPIVDENDANPFRELGAFYRSIGHGNQDIEGRAPYAIGNLLANHPHRDKLFPSLDDYLLKRIVSKLDNVFEENEHVNWSEGGENSYDRHPDDPIGFAFDVGPDILALSSEDLGFKKFEYSDNQTWQDRRAITLKVVEEKFQKFGGINALLPESVKS